MRRLFLFCIYLMVMILISLFICMGVGSNAATKAHKSCADVFCTSPGRTWLFLAEILGRRQPQTGLALGLSEACTEFWRIDDGLHSRCVD
jgi:hypothetical protein